MTSAIRRGITAFILGAMAATGITVMAADGAHMTRHRRLRRMQPRRLPPEYPTRCR